MAQPQLSDLISKKFYNIDYITNGGLDGIQKRLTEAMIAYKNALSIYNSYKNGITNIISMEDIVKCKELFPFLNLDESIALSEHNNELSIAINKAPIYVNWRSTLQLDNIHQNNKEEAKKLLEDFPSLKYDQIFMISPAMYNSNAIFIGKDVKLINTTNIFSRTTASYYKIGNTNSSLPGCVLHPSKYGTIPEIVTQTLNNIHKYQPLHMIDMQHPGTHPHVISRDHEDENSYATSRICFGNHHFMQNYQNFLDSNEYLHPSKIMIDFFYDYLDWSNHVTTDDNYSNTFLKLKETGRTAPVREVVKHLNFQYTEDKKHTDILEYCLLRLSSFLTENYHIYINKQYTKLSDKMNPLYKDLVHNLVQLKIAQSIPGEESIIYNSPIVSIFMAISIIDREYESQLNKVLLLPDLYAKLYLLLIQQYSGHISGNGVSSSGIMVEAGEYVPIIHDFQLPYSKKMLTNLLQAPKNLLYRLLQTNNENVEALKNTLRALDAPTDKEL